MHAVELKRLEVDAMRREVYDLRVFVVGGGFPYIKMFHDAGFRGARNVAEADIICFTGGEDVDPSLYGEKPIPGTHFNPKRDEAEALIWGECLGMQKPQIGICRGGQFLNVMCNGKLHQDVNNHAIYGGHAVKDIKTGDILEGMTSTHHQMMIPGPGAEVLAVAKEATEFKSESHHRIIPEPLMEDTEVVWYPEYLSLCFQPHPEFSHGPCRNYFLDLVDEYILPAC